MLHTPQTLDHLAAGPADTGPSRALKILELPFVWLERLHARKELAGLSDAALKDIGLARGDIQAEVDKPFWKS